MSQIQALLAEFQRGGGAVVIDGGKLKARYPETCKQAVAPLLARLREHREEVIQFLNAVPTRELRREIPSPSPVTGMAPCGDIACAGCYQVEPGKSIHPRKAGEPWLRWLELWKPKAKERKN